LPGDLGDRLRSVLGSKNGSVMWLSLTPFVAPRHVKERGRNTITGQVAAELAARGFPELQEVRTLPLDGSSGRYRFRHFIRQRRGGPPAPMDCGLCLQIRLAAPAPGPIALGYGSHFGIGLFRSIEEWV
jgi:CRISPR-associated protein Csb2